MCSEHQREADQRDRKLFAVPVILEGEPRKSQFCSQCTRQKRGGLILRHQIWFVTKKSATCLQVEVRLVVAIFHDKGHLA